MHRLRDQTSSPDPLTARAAQLLAAMPPLDVDRLRAATPRPPERAPSRVAVRLRPALALAVTLGSVAAAAATLHRVGPARVARGAPVSSPAPSPEPRLATADRAAGRPAAEPPAPPPAVGEAVERPAAPHPAAASPRAAWPAESSRPAAKDHARPGAGASIDDESALVVGAVRALRRDGDPARAQQLAEQALQRYPRGVQVEEAMDVAMEAASARGDTAAARRAAGAYLERFPSGRFAERARRIGSTSLR